MSDSRDRRLCDASWSTLASAIANIASGRGRPAQSDRRFIDGVRWILRTGAPWRDLPQCFGAWQTVYRRFARWSQRGLWQALWREIDAIAHEKKKVSAVIGIDSTSIRVHQHGAAARGKDETERGGRSRGGRTTKLHMACEAQDGAAFRIRRFALSPGNMHEIMAAPLLHQGVKRADVTRSAVLADKAYDAAWLRERLRSAGQVPVIPSRSRRLPWSEKQARLYRQRNVVERAFGRLKHFRRVASRFERLSCHFGGFLQAAVVFSLVTTTALPR